MKRARRVFRHRFFFASFVALAAARRGKKFPKEEATIVFPRCEIRSASETWRMKVYRIQFKLDVSMLNVRRNVYSNNVGKLPFLSKAFAVCGKLRERRKGRNFSRNNYQGRNCCVSFLVDSINQLSFPVFVAADSRATTLTAFVKRRDRRHVGARLSHPEKGI